MVALTTFPGRPATFQHRDLVFREISLLGSRYATRAEVVEAAGLVAGGHVTPVIGAVAPPTGVLDIHDELRNGTLIGRGALDWSNSMSDITDIRIPDDVDGVFVGGGHNALICAAYLARLGLKVVVCEAAPAIGGGTTTAEVTLPFFRHNLHAYFVRWTPEYAVWTDLDLGRYGVRSIFPEVQNAVPFDGGERALVTYSDLDRSLAEIARLSPADAASYAAHHAEFSDLTRLIDTPLRFSGPAAARRAGGTARKEPTGSPLPRARPELAARAGAIAVRVRAAPQPDPVQRVGARVRPQPGRGRDRVDRRSRHGQLPPGAAGRGRHLRGRQGHRLGGGRRRGDAAHQRPGGLDRRLQRPRHRRHPGRRPPHRRQAVRGERGPAPITMLELVGAGHLDASLAEDLGGYRWLEEALFGVHWALADRPRFTAEAYNPDVPRSLNLALGYESSQHLEAHMHAVRAARNLDDGPIHVSVPTLHDPSQAPADRHTTFGWHFVPARPPGEPGVAHR
jgi:hypothetical protein